MKKKIFILIFILVLVGGVIWYKYLYLKDTIPILEVMEEKAQINTYYIYGTTLNLEGEIDGIDTNYDNIDLVLYNGEFISYDIEVVKEYNEIEFKISDYINDGMYLENINVGTYYLFIRTLYKSTTEDEEDIYNYYILNNNTEYTNNTYYTLSNTNRKIIINQDEYYNTMTFKITDNQDDNIYDIVIDPGHGGIDSGTVSTNEEYTESELVMEFSRILYNKLTELGLKVKLTREEDTLSSAEYFEEYNVEGTNYIGRAVIPRNTSSKYAFSIHLNSLDNNTTTRGLEIYTAQGINYAFANTLVKNITEQTSIPASSKLVYKVDTGIYTHNFTEEEVASSLASYDAKGYTRYNVTTNSNYLYMIRETGGIITGAYVDDSNPTVGENPYYNSNIGTETYLIELGYLSNESDLNYIINSMEEYANTIANTIATYILDNE